MIDVELYATPEGKEVVADFLLSLPTKHKAKALREIDLLAEWGAKLKEPYTKHIKGEIWELRIKFSTDISRIVYFFVNNNKIVLLHGFIKKTDKTPVSEIITAEKRLAEFKERQ